MDEIRNDLNAFPQLEQNADLWDEMRSLRRNYLQGQCLKNPIGRHVVEAVREGHLDPETYHVIWRQILRMLSMDAENLAQSLGSKACPHKKECLVFPVYLSYVKLELVEVWANLALATGFDDPKTIARQGKRFEREAWRKALQVPNTWLVEYEFVWNLEKLDNDIAEAADQEPFRLQLDEKFSDFREQVMVEMHAFLEHDIYDEEKRKAVNQDAINEALTAIKTLPTNDLLNRGELVTAMLTFDQVLVFARARGMEIPEGLEPEEEGVE